MAQEFFGEKKEQELAQNEYMLKKDVYASDISYNTDPREIFSFRLDYYGGSVTFTINKKGYKVTIEDDKQGNFTLINRDADNSNFSQQIGEILNEFGNFGNSVDLTYLKPFSEVDVNGKYIKVDKNKMLNLLGKLFHTTLSYIKNNFSSHHFTLDFDKVETYYTYMFRKPELRLYNAYSSEYIYDVAYPPINSLTIYKTKSNGKSEEVFEIYTDISKYSRHILSDVINLVRQSKIKSNEYLIEIEGKNVTINKKPVKADDNAVKDIIDSMENQVGYVINTVKSKLDMLEQDFLSS
jgi:hypothetical protein